jgi:choline dehydrogenase-like flavoprotein
VVIGGGSAGCVVARRLADHYKSKKIALLEAGQKDPESLKVPAHVILPLAGFPPSFKKYNWHFET